MTLRDSFKERVHRAIQDMKALGYDTSVIENMLRRGPADHVAYRLLATDRLQTGLRNLVDGGRADLCIESIILEPEFDDLFGVELRNEARKRLEAVGYTTGQD